MKQYFLNRDLYSWRYKEQSGQGWSYFSDNVSDLDSINNYLSDQGIRDPVSVSFVTKDMRPANVFEISRKDNSIDVVMNAGNKKFFLYEFDFIPFAELEQYFHDRTTPDIIEQADRLQNLPKIKFYKDNADQTTLTDYKTMVRERMTDDAIRNHLTDNEPGKVSEVYFND